MGQSHKLLHPDTQDWSIVKLYYENTIFANVALCLLYIWCIKENVWIQTYLESYVFKALTSAGVL